MGHYTNNVWIDDNGSALSPTDVQSIVNAIMYDFYTSPYQNTLIVDAFGKGAYTTIAQAVAAINAAGDASSSNRYLIELKNGRYAEDVVLPGWVNMIGQGWMSSRIVGKFTISSNSLVSNLYISPPSPETQAIISVPNQTSGISWFIGCYIQLATTIDATIVLITHNDLVGQDSDLRFEGCMFYPRNASAGASAYNILARNIGAGVGDIEFHNCHIKQSYPVAASHMILAQNETAGGWIDAASCSWDVYNNPSPLAANNLSTGKIFLDLSYINYVYPTNPFLTSGSNVYLSPTIIASLQTTGNALVGTATDGMTAGGSIAISQDFAHRGTKVGFYNTAPVVKPTITGSRGGNNALADILTKLASLGLFIDNTSP